MLKKLDWVHPRMEELGMLLSDPAWCGSKSGGR